MFSDLKRTTGILLSLSGPFSNQFILKSRDRLLLSVLVFTRFVRRLRARIIGAPTFSSAYGLPRVATLTQLDFAAIL